jgi:replicative DNA helicase
MLKQKIVSTGEIYEDWEKSLQSRSRTPEMPLSLTELNRILWGVHRGELLIIGARPSQGKTSLCLQIAQDLATSGFVTYFVSLETSRMGILERMFCQKCSISNEQMRMGIISEGVKEKMEQFKTWVQDVPLLITDRIGYKFSEITNILTHVKPKPDVLILDYIQMVGCYGTSKLDAITEYMRQLKELATEHNIALIVASQINRGNMERTNQRPMLSDLKGSGALEETADCVLGLYWNMKHEDCKDPSQFEIAVMKQRDGATGIVKVNFFPQYYQFKDRFPKQLLGESEEEK